MVDPQNDNKFVKAEEATISLAERSKSDLAEKRGAFLPHMAMNRTFVFAIGGCVVVIVFGFATGISGWTRAANICVGLMTAGAACGVGGLLGFIFGVPYRRESSDGNRENAQNHEGILDARNSSSQYRPNAALEQISEWLSKMLVGAGLVELTSFPAKLDNLAKYISRGIGGGTQAETFSLAALIYFATCGFIFGFIWARIFLKRWFTLAD
jgi:hypothetical protein